MPMPLISKPKSRLKPSTRKASATPSLGTHSALNTQGVPDEIALICETYAIKNAMAVASAQANAVLAEWPMPCVICESLLESVCGVVSADIIRYQQGECEGHCPVSVDEFRQVNS